MDDGEEKKNFFSPPGGGKIFTDGLLGHFFGVTRSSSSRNKNVAASEFFLFWKKYLHFLILNLFIFKPSSPQAAQLRLLQEKQQRCTSLDGPAYGHTVVDGRREKSPGARWI